MRPHPGRSTPRYRSTTMISQSRRVTGRPLPASSAAPCAADYALYARLCLSRTKKMRILCVGELWPSSVCERWSFFMQRDVVPCRGCVRLRRRGGPVWAVHNRAQRQPQAAPQHWHCGLRPRANAQNGAIECQWPSAPPSTVRVSQKRLGKSCKAQSRYRGPLALSFLRSLGPRVNCIGVKGKPGCTPAGSWAPVCACVGEQDPRSRRRTRSRQRRV